MASPSSDFVFAPCRQEIDSTPLDGPSQVVVCERRAERFQTVSQIVGECGSQTLQCAGYSALDSLPASPGTTFALVGLEECPAENSPALNAVRGLTRRGLFVICYADHALKWPIGIRCNVLLAGALILVDSAKPEFSRELLEILEQVLRLETDKRVAEAAVNQQMRELGIIAESRVMFSIFSWVLKASTLSDLPVLITGETGTGKELLVNAIYHLDRKRSRGPLVAVNCGAITAGVAESELFGHRRGAFTGAERDRPGLIRSANGGILFLDEIGDLEPALQAKLLRVLQENRVLGVGEDREAPVDVRVIAATNRNPEEMAQQGTFRADLFHRLNILSIHIPPLHERPADLAPLVQYFIEKYRPISNMKTLSVAPEFVEALAQLQLPGNVRELENLIRRALVKKTTASPLGLSDLPKEILGELAGQQPKPSLEKETADNNRARRPREISAGLELEASLFQLLQAHDGSLTRTMDHCERLLIGSALEDSHGNQSLVAKALGITPRTVYNKIRKHGLR